MAALRPEAVAVLRALSGRETAAGLVSIAELVDDTGLDPMVVVNEVERFIRAGVITGRLQKLMSGGDPRPWFLVNPLISDHGREILDAHPATDASLTATRVGRLSDIRRWDAFVSHAHEDKADFVADLARELTSRGLSIWYDDDVLEVGDSVRKAIDDGLSLSDFGIVVISPHYIRKDWTNRELDGILARERGEKRLLPVWHRVERDDVESYSPTLAGRFAVRSTIGVSAIADALCRAMGRGSTRLASPVIDVPPGPRFLTQVGLMANSRIYSWVVIAPAVETNEPFADDEIETISSWLNTIEPHASVRQAGSSYIWMNLLDDTSTAMWSAEVHPGPVVTVLSAFDARKISPTVGDAVSFDALAGWWAKVVAALPTIAGNLGWDRVRVGLGLNPYGSDSTRLVELDFEEAPRPKRRADPHQIPPWNTHLPPFDPFKPPPDLFGAPIRDLLDSLSYGRVEETEKWVAEGLSSGQLKAKYPGPPV